MGHRIFLSYSTKDQAAAEEVCRALESQGIGCWIAPRDIVPGSQWGGSIVEAIEKCEAVLVLFSDASNNSPQVAREMEVAVAQRRPLIPVRIADAMPTDDMKYFLGVSHWLNAYERPLPTYLSDIVAATRRVLERETGPLARVKRMVPRTRNGQIMVGGAAVIIVAALTASLMRPSTPSFKFPVNAWAGRWEAHVPDGNGGKTDCILDVQSMGQAQFSDGCPFPFTGQHVNVAAADGSVYAPGIFQDGDTGTFSLMGGTVHGTVGAYRIKGSRLTIRGTALGDVTWKKISSSKPLKDATDDLLPRSADWPVKGLPDLARKATAYVRSHWQKDAVLMSVKVEILEGALTSKINSPAGPIGITYSYYSPETQEGIQLSPADMYSKMFSFGVVDWNASNALPDNFLDLPEAVNVMRQQGMRAKQIKSAELRNWGSATYQGSNTMSGIEWMLRSTLDEGGVVRATN